MAGLVTTNDLEKRIWRAVELSADPGALSAALQEMLPKCTFEVRDDVPTARITNGPGGMAIEFGREFLARELCDDRDFLFVLMHEIYHHVLGHLRVSRGDRVSRIYRSLSNIAADMLVNRTVCQRFFPDGVPLLDRMYPVDSLPGALLRNPGFSFENVAHHDARVWLLRNFEIGLTKMGANRGLCMRVFSVYRLAWGQGAPYETILERLLALFRSIDPLSFPQVILLGDHERAAGGLGGIFSMDGTGDKGDPFTGGGEDREEIVRVKKTEHNQGVAAALRRALEVQANRWRMHDPIACPGVVCVPGRRDAAFLGAGMYPVFYQANKTEFEPEQLAHVYVDVSGSMVCEIPHMFAVLAASRELVADPIHEFSERIEDVTMADFAKGVCHTTGGTDFTPIMTHAMARKFRQVVVFTDGCACFEDVVGRSFKQSGIKLHLVFVDSRSHSRRDCPLVPLAESVFVLS